MEIKQENIVNFFNQNVAFKTEFIDQNNYNRKGEEQNWNSVSLSYLFGKHLILKHDSELKPGEMVLFKLLDRSQISMKTLGVAYLYAVKEFDDFSHQMVLQDFNIDVIPDKD